MNNSLYLYGRSKELMQFGSQELPVSKEINTIDWVIFGAVDQRTKGIKDKDWDNQYPQYIDFLSKSSAKNSAILKAKNRYVYGKGFELDTHGLDQLGQTPALIFIEKLKASKVFPKIIADGNKFNGFCVEVIPAKVGGGITFHYLPFKCVRVSKDEYDKDGTTLLPKKYYYTKDWSKKGQAPKQNKDFTVFHPFEWDKKLDKSKRYIIYYKNEEYSEEFYPMPDYIGAVPYISADSEVGNFVDKNTKNGFSGGYIFNFYGDPTEEQKKQLSDKVDENLHGTDNAGKSLKVFSIGDKGVEVTPLNANGQDDRYNNLNNTIRTEIFTGHCTPTSAVEIPPSGTGLTNNADQDRTAIEKWQEAWVIPNQEPYNELANALMSYNGIAGTISLARLEAIKPEISETVLKETLSDKQFREFFGLPKSDKVVNPVIDALRTLSPLVQNKILDELNTTEIRSLISLVTDPSTGVVKTTETTTKQFSAQDDLKIIEAFESCGIEDSEYHCFSSADLYATDTFDATKQAQFMKHQFASKVQNSILNLLIGDPNLKPSEIANLIGETPKNVNDLLAEMEAEGLIENGQPTEQGQRSANENEIIAVYKYKVRDDAPPLETESRQFCKDLMRLSRTRSWTIEQIQNISNQVGYDVFSRRGGWYHNPETGRNTPYCRHIFSVQLVRKK